MSHRRSRNPRPSQLLSLSVLLGAVASSCALEVDDHAAQRAAVIFGADDRQEYYEATDPGFAELLRAATVTLVDPRYIDVSNPDGVVPDTITLGEYQDLCPGERYAEQPAMGSCSGTLIDDDLVLTAAHCVDETVCADWYFVFDFYMSGPGELHPMTAADVYRCAEILVHAYSPDGAPRPWDDYAVVRLDRPVDEQRTPAPVAMEPTLAAGDAITVLGFGNGIPGKIHGGAIVHEAVDAFGYFRGSTDTFAGNSGSGTYGGDHELVGVFVRGGHDDYTRAGGGCQVVNTLGEDEASQEYDYAYKAVRTLCEAGHVSARLCGSEVPDPDPPPSDPPPPDPQSSDPDPMERGAVGCGVAPASSPPSAWLVRALAALHARRSRRARPRLYR